jgi:hypothetical protein
MLNGMEQQSQRVETDILNWTSFQDTAGIGGEVNFTLPRKGILAGEFVSLQLSLLKGTATNKMPMCVGILGCLEEATLFYQNEVIQSTRFAGLRNRLMNLKEDPDIRSQKHNVEYGAFDLMDVRSGKNGALSLPGQFFYDGNQVGLNLSSVGLTQANISEFNNADRDAQFDAAATADGTANYRIKLAHLFPILSQIDLPLGLMNGQFTIRIRFADDVIGNRCVPSSSWSNVNPTAETAHAFVADNRIDPNTCNLCVDYIYYDNEEGKTNPYDLLAASISKGGLELIYTDLVNINISAPNLAAQPAASTDLIISNRLNINNQVVRNLLIAMPRQIDTTNLTIGGRMNQVQGRYESLASMGIEKQGTLQLLVNNLPIFVNPLNTDTKIYTEISEALGTTLKVNQGATSWFNQQEQVGAAVGIDPTNSYQMTSTATAGGINYRLNGFAYGKSTSWALDGAGQVYATGLCGTEGYMGIDLSHSKENIVGAGTSVGTSPLELIITKVATTQDYDAQQIIVWAECERIMRISNGELFVSGS